MPIDTPLQPQPFANTPDQCIDRPPVRISVCPPANLFLAISTAGRRLVQQSAMVAPHLALAVVEGEAGSGKQTLARLLHSQSPFARAPFQRCDAREWLLGEIDPQFLSGFIYLDRIDLLAAPGQALLLRVLKSFESRSRGSFALVASLESPLREMAMEGRILPDLAFRLAAIRFAVPPLRERREDIAPLAALFLERLSQRYRRPRFCLAPGAVARLLQHHWPGNARELSSVLESAVLESDRGIIRAEDLSIVDAPIPISQAHPQRSESLNLDEVIKNHILLVLELNHGNKLKSARQLGISRSTLYRLLEGESST